MNSTCFLYRRDSLGGCPFDQAIFANNKEINILIIISNNSRFANRYINKRSWVLPIHVAHSFTHIHNKVYKSVKVGEYCGDEYRPCNTDSVLSRRSHNPTCKYSLGKLLYKKNG